jgi:hypothetical protein
MSTVICGDNCIAERGAEVLRRSSSCCEGFAPMSSWPPAFNAGRQHRVPAVAVPRGGFQGSALTAMSDENPDARPSIARCWSWSQCDRRRDGIGGRTAGTSHAEGRPW